MGACKLFCISAAGIVIGNQAVDRQIPLQIDSVPFRRLASPVVLAACSLTNYVALLS